MLTGAEHISLEGLKGWGGWGLFFLAVIWWIRGIPERRRADMESDASLRGDLLKRVGDLEQELRDERRRCDEEMAKLRAQVEGITRQFIHYQLIAAQAVPPASRSPAIMDMLGQLEKSSSQQGEEDMSGGNSRPPSPPPPPPPPGGAANQKAKRQ